MGSYKWGISYDCPMDDAECLVETYGFEYDDTDQAYIKEIDGWNDLSLIVKPGEIEAVFIWMGGDTTEIYFDYLINCGVLLGQLMVELEKLSEKHLLEHEPESEDSEEEDG